MLARFFVPAGAVLFFADFLAVFLGGPLRFLAAPLRAAPFCRFLPATSPRFFRFSTFLWASAVTSAMRSA